MAFERFYVKRINDYVAFVELTKQQMLADVPAQLPCSTKVITPAVLDEEGNIITPAVTEPKKVHEWVYKYLSNIDDTKAVIALRPQTHWYGRLHPVDEAELTEIKTFMESKGLLELNWMNLKEARQYLSTSPEYEFHYEGV